MLYRLLKAFLLIKLSTEVQLLAINDSIIISLYYELSKSNDFIRKHGQTIIRTSAILSNRAC